MQFILGVVFLLPISTILLAAGATNNSPGGSGFDWTVYGPLGGIAIFAGWLVRLVLAKLFQELTERQKKIDDLEKDLRERAFPLMAKNQDTLKEAAQALAQIGVILAVRTQQGGQLGPQQGGMT